MDLNVIIWQVKGDCEEPDWMHVVAKNLTHEKAQKIVRKYLLEEFNQDSPHFEYFWYTTVDKVPGIGGKKNYKVELAEL